jgi:hypothetical protein
MICPGRDARRFFPPQARHVVVRVACQEGRERDFSGFSHYSVRDLARLMAGRGEVITMSPATVQRILTEMVLKPHRVRYWLTRTDPAFERKMDEIVNLYLAPPRNSRLLCIDEKTGIQALERRYPTLPRRPGHIERREFGTVWSTCSRRSMCARARFLDSAISTTAMSSCATFCGDCGHATQTGAGI